MTQLEINLPVKGKSYDAKKDKKRIESLRSQIWDLMADGKWRTLKDISDFIELPLGCDLTRRLREMRDIGYKLFKERTEMPGVWIYRAVKR